MGIESSDDERSFLTSVKAAKMTYFGHILREKGNCLEKEIIQSATPGNRAIGGDQRQHGWTISRPRLEDRGTFIED